MKDQKSRQPFYMTVLTHIWGIAISCGLWVLFSIYLSVVNSDWIWFSRSGSILTLGGAALAVRSLLRSDPKGIFGPPQRIIIDCGGAFDSPEDIAHMRQSRMDGIAAFFGFWFIVIGTGIWGYGDLIGKSVGSGLQLCNIIHQTCYLAIPIGIP